MEFFSIFFVLEITAIFFCGKIIQEIALFFLLTLAFIFSFFSFFFLVTVSVSDFFYFIFGARGVGFCFNFCFSFFFVFFSVNGRTGCPPFSPCCLFLREVLGAYPFNWKYTGPAPGQPTIWIPIRELRPTFHRLYIEIITITI